MMKEYFKLLIFLSFFLAALILPFRVKAQLLSLVDPCQADLSQNQIVDVPDVRILLNSWLSSGPDDLNSDARVNSLDLATLVSVWGQTCQLPPSLTPSPLPDLLWADEFISQDSRWEWGYQAGTGYHRLTSVEAASVVEIGITGQSSQRSYSDCSLHENGHPHTYGIFEARLRCTDDNGTIPGGIAGQGTRGWGFWHVGTDALGEINVAWFWSASPESYSSLRGLQAMVVQDGTFHLQELLEIGMKEWHIYRFELLPSGTRFLVDGVEVASTSHRPSQSQRIELWIDNYKLDISGSQLRKSYLDVDQDQKMYIDWIKFYQVP